VHAIAPIAFVLISYQFLVRVAKLLRGLLRPEREEVAS
jgi:hypothetical protein